MADVSDPPPLSQSHDPVLVETTKQAILGLTMEKFLDDVVPSDSPYSRNLHEYMARLLTVDLMNRPNTEQAIRELDDLIATMGGKIRHTTEYILRKHISFILLPFFIIDTTLF